MELDVSKMRENLVLTRSWEPMEYTGWADENVSWKTDSDIGDWSQMVEYHVSGPDALKFFSAYAVNNFDDEKYAIGQAKHIIFCTSKGHLIGEGILIRYGKEDFEFQSGGPVWSWLDFNAKKGEFNLTVAEKRDTKFKYQVSGPKSLFLLEEVTGQSLRDIKFMHVGKASILGVEVDMLRQGMSGEVGFEIQGPKEMGRRIWNHIFEVGQKYNIRRIGAKTAMVKHMEACFPTVVHDYLPAVMEEEDYFEAYREQFKDFTRFLKVSGSYEGTSISDWYRTPTEFGWSNRINLNHEFHGKEALAELKANPPRTLVTLVWNAEDVADIEASMVRDEEPYDYMELPRTQWYSCNAHKVLCGGKVVGIATNRIFSYYFHKTISHCSIDTELAVMGKEVEVIWGEPGHRQKTVRATIAPSPFKQDNRYVDLHTLPAGE